MGVGIGGAMSSDRTTVPIGIPHQPHVDPLPKDYLGNRVINQSTAAGLESGERAVSPLPGALL